MFCTAQIARTWFESAKIAVTRVLKRTTAVSKAAVVEAQNVEDDE